jgi:L-phenylalanine/L-methionine N-acetyltransferase
LSTKTQAWTIRRAAPQDAAGLSALFTPEAVFTNTLQDPLPSPERWAKNLSEPHSVHNLVAVHGEQIVGTAGIYPNTRMRNRHVGHLGIAVAQDWQGRGVGTDLLRTVLDHADRWQALLRVELQVYTDNAVAIALYQKFGFEIEGTLRRNALRNGAYVDSLLMARLHPSPPALR